MPEFIKRKNKSGEVVYLVRVYLGKDENGKNTFLNKTVHGGKKDAERFARQAMTDRDKGVLSLGRHTIQTLLDDLLLDYRVNGKCLDWAELVVRKHLAPHFGSVRIEKLNTSLLQNYIARRQEAGAANQTINHALALLRHAYYLGFKRTPPKVARVPYFPMLKVDNVRKGFFEHEPFVAVRRELPEEIRPVITFAYSTGCRKGEILGLQWPQIDLAERIVRLEPGETKNDQARVIPLVPELYEMLAVEKAKRDTYWPHSLWVFSRAGERILDFRNAWGRACKAAGLVTEKDKPTRLFHDLRRTGVRNLIRAGVPERVAMMISGHKTRSVFDRYNVVDERDLRDAGRRLGEYLASKELQTTEPSATPPKEQDRNKSSHIPHTRDRMPKQVQ